MSTTHFTAFSPQKNHVVHAHFRKNPRKNAYRRTIFHRQEILFSAKKKSPP
jgi:hypothetical protein